MIKLNTNTMLKLKNGILAITAATLWAAPSASGQVLFSDNFETDSSAQWSRFPGSGNGTEDYTAQFAFDYSTNEFIANGVTNTIPAAPNSTGTTRGLKLTVNNNDNTASASAVSLYPIGQSFSNQFALRFDMWLNYNGPAFGGTGSTEHGIFGIDHAGDKVNWDNTTFNSDGLWFSVAGEAGAGSTAISDYNAYAGDGFTPRVRFSAFDAGMLDRDGDGTEEREVNPDQPATFPLKLMYPAPLFETPGAPGKRWVQVEVRQRHDQFGSPVVTWLIDGYVIAEHSQGVLFGQTAGNIMIGLMDAFNSIANPREQNFAIFDNVRVVDLSNEAARPVVEITASDSAAVESGGDTGEFTITRAGDTTAALTVELRVGGTAANGTDYTMIPTSVTIPAGSASTTIVLTPQNDSIGEALESVSLTIAGSQLYEVRDALFSQIELQDDGDVPTANVRALKPVAYEGNEAHVAKFSIQFSTPNSADTTVQYTVGGTAAAGIDYVAINNSVVVIAGETNATVTVVPIDNAALDADRTVTLTLGPASGYVLGTSTTATATIRNDDLAPGALLYAENFDVDPTSNWTINQGPGDGVADFFFDYGFEGVPPAPNSTNEASRGLKLQANITSGIFGGLSVSPTGQTFSGNYRLRFDLWQNYNGPLNGGGSGSTQVTGAGVGTAGTTAQWAGGTQDSVWFASTGDGGSGIDYRAHSSVAATGYVESSGVFAAGTAAGVRNNTHAYYAEFGLETAPADQLMWYSGQTGVTAGGTQGFLWHDVVITKIGNEVSWFIDGLRIATVDASTANLGGGNILFNYYDINATRSADLNAEHLLFGLVDNIRVEALAGAAQEPDITGIAIVDGKVQITFTGAASDSPSDFTLQSSAVVTGGYTDESAAAITEPAAGQFQAAVDLNGPQRFYRIAR